MGKSYRAFLVLTVTAILMSGQIQAQNLLNNPESIIFDSLQNRYLVSNYGDGNIIQIDEFGNQSYFDTTLTRIAGLMSKGDTLFVASNQNPYIGLVAYSLLTDEMLFYLPIASVGLLNDLDYDHHGNIYISDYWDNKLFKVNMNTLTYSLFVDDIYMPNGILCDTLNNRLLVITVNAPNRPILSVDFDDPTVINVVVNTYIYSMDGITRDSDHNIYLSSWWSNSCYRYDSSFTNPPEIVSSGHDGPADIYVNQRDNILCVPNFYPHTIEFIELSPNDIAEPELPDRICYSKNYPNPFNSRTTIEYTIAVSSNVRLDIFDLMGNKVTTLVNGNQQAGSHKTIWNAAGFASGMYFYTVQTADYTKTGKMTLLK